MEQVLPSIGRKSESLKTIDDVFDAVREALERGHEVRAMQDRSFAESYARFGATLICDLEVTMPLESLSSGVGRDNKPVADGKLYASIVYRCKPSNEGKLSMCNQKPVFIFDVEVVESEENLTLPSLAGLYDIHDESFDLFAGILFQSIDGSFKTVTGFMDREFCVTTGRNNCLNPSVVESGAEIVQSVSQNQKKFIGELLSRSDAESIISGLRVWFDGQSVRVVVSEDLALHAKVIDVLFGPF